MYPLLSEYIEAIKAAEDNFEELKNLRPVLNEDGDPVFSSGGFAVVFKMKDEKTGRMHAVKCFLKEQEGRADAYRLIAEELEYVSSTFLTPINYLDKELFVDTKASDETEFPVLLMDWVEGQTLDKYIRDHINDQYELSLLAYQFSRLAMWLMPQPFAHGDLKPDNIIVKGDGTLVLVDYDGMYVPAMKGEKARELGSPDFRHPSRTEDVFDEHIDDFSLVSILLSLKAISLQPDLLEEYGAKDRLLFSANDYRNLSESQVMDALKTMMQDSELATLYSLFILTSAQNNLSQASFRLLNLSRPQAPKQADLSEYCSIKIEDVDGYEVDKFGAIYSHNHKILLRLPYHIIQYNVEEGTEIIASGAFDHFDVCAGGGVVDLSEAYLERLYLPTSVKYITESSFGEDGRRIKEIRVATNPYYFKSYLENWSDKINKGKPYDEVLTRSKSIFDIEGAEYSQDGKTLISLYWLSSDVLSYKIKEGVKTIKFGAAQLAKNIHEIVVPSGVEFIEGAAFVNSSLSCIKFPLTLRPIESDIFYGCDELEKIVIPEGTKGIYEEMLPGHKDKLIEEKDNNDYSTKIDKEDFENAWTDEFGVIYSADRKRLLKAPKDIKDYKIKEGTKVICNGFSSQYEWGRNVTGAFKDCALLKSLTIPDSVTKIGNVAFKWCKSLTYIAIPDSVTQIGAGAFSGCENLKSVVLPNDLKEITNEVFSGCVGITNIIIPYSVTKIGRCSFYCCEGLSTIIIPKEVVEIGEEAFAGCINLVSVTLSSDIKDIGYGIFNGCRKLDTINMTSTHYMFGQSLKDDFGEKIPEYKDLLWEVQDTEMYSTIVNDYDKRNNYKDEYGVIYSEDGKRLLWAPNDLIEYSIKEGTKFICEYAFKDCNNLKSINIPSTIKEIGEHAFEDCCQISTIIIPNSVTKVGNDIFRGCKGLTSITISNRLDIFPALPYCINIKQIEIPDGIKSIGRGSFWCCHGLKSIFIPANVKTISGGTFVGCSNLKSINVDKGNTYFDSRNHCNAIVKGNTLVDGCLGTKIPEGIEIIGESAFEGCLNLDKIEIPKTVKIIEDFAFKKCINLNSIIIPDGITNIGTSAFEGCQSLISITIPNSVNKIGWHALWNCSSLQFIYIPKGTKEKFDVMMPSFERNGIFVEQ